MKEFHGFRLDEVNQCLGDDPKTLVFLDTLPECRDQLIARVHEFQQRATQSVPLRLAEGQ
jgi:hypothetical protein